MIQEYTSAKSCINQVPAGFKIVDKHFGWKPFTNNLDIGGGKYNSMTLELAKKSVCNLIYDPYNRTERHNNDVLLICNQVIIDTVTIFNVLNVIKEKEIQLEVLKLAYKKLKFGGMVFVRSTYMNSNKASGVTKSGTFQHYLTMKEYLEIVKEVFPNADLKYGIIYATK
jgi:hypothetical protein